MTRLPTALMLCLTTLPVAGAGELSLFYRDYTDADLRGVTDNPTVESRSVGGTWQWRDTASDPWGAWTLDYRYDTLLVRSGQPASNGHLHSLGLTGEWRIGDYTLILEPALQASSNMFKNLDFSGALVLDASGYRNQPLDADRSWQWGLAGDHRFGPYQVYPLLGYRTPLAGGELELLLPQLIAYNGPNGRWSITLEKTGRRWATLDKELTVEGKTYYDDWQFGVEYRLRLPESIEWTVGVGIAFQRELRYLDLEAGVVEREIDDSFYGELALRF